MTENTLPILYSFRRCPYAIRARLGLIYANINCVLREVHLKNKPEHMLTISPKGTVPVLLLPDGRIIDESLDILQWALQKNDPEYLYNNGSEFHDIIAENDTHFKPALDRYKYPDRFADSHSNTSLENKEICLTWIRKLNDLIHKSNGFLFSDKISWADIAILPFIRQFYMVDKSVFENQDMPYLEKWLFDFLQSDILTETMVKSDPWSIEDEPIYLISKNR